MFYFDSWSGLIPLPHWWRTLALSDLHARMFVVARYGITRRALEIDAHDSFPRGRRRYYLCASERRA
jgi:hypothetical protein